MEQKKFDVKDVKVYRTKEGTMFEIAVALVLIIAWVISFCFEWTKPLEFFGIHLHTLALSLTAIFLTVCAYHPRFIHLNNKRSGGFTNIRQVEIAIRMVRVIAVELALLVLVLNILSVRGIDMSELVGVPFVIVIIATSLCFSFLAHKAK